MKTATLLLALALTLNMASAQNKAPQKASDAKTKTETKVTDKKVTTKPDGNVYYCDSKTATSYHSDKKCSGLAKCSASVKEMSKTDAEKAGKKACKMCVK